MINWNDLPTHIVAGIIVAVILAVAGSAWLLWKKNYEKVVRWLAVRPWAVSTLIAISSAVIAGVIVFVVVETQLAQLKKDLSTISPEANGPAAKLSQVSDLAEALAKVPWIDAKLREFDDTAKVYNETYVDDVRKNKVPTQAALNLQAGETINEIAKAVLKRDFDIDAHPHFDAYHYCCWHNDKNLPLEVDIFETANMVVDTHHTTETTIGEIRKMIQAERAKYQAVIDRAAQR